MSLIVAMADGGVIGHDGDLPWHLPADLARFKSLTMGHHLLVGRRTWESIGRPLPGRRMVVISRGRPELPEGVELAGSLEEALDLARTRGDDEVFVAGGGEIYRLALPLADRVYLTRVEAAIDGDVTFPVLEQGSWRLVAAEARPTDDRNTMAMRFEVWERAAPG